jgi:hypothetical protein
MGYAMQCFSIEDLERLDANQLAFLRQAIEREIGNNPEIQRILKERFQAMYDRMAPPAPPPRPRRTRGSRPPPATDPSASEEK